MPGEIRDLCDLNPSELLEKLRYYALRKAYDRSWLEMLLVRAYELGKGERNQDQYRS